MKTEVIALNPERNVTLTCYLQEVGGEFRNIVKRPAMLVLPGGGYSMCSEREADPVAFQYLNAGYQTFVLRYSVKQHALWPNPLSDYEQAIRLIRDKAEDWHIYADKVAVVGFSAGGHLAAAAATMAENRPNAAILGYAVTEGASVKARLPSAPDLVEQVDRKTPPCFLFATRTDNIVPISNSVHFMDALDRNGIMFESHIYGYGPHGFSICNDSVNAPGTKITPRASRWVKDSIEWLGEIFGEFGQWEMTAPKFSPRINGDGDEFLSVECTMGHLMSVPEARAILAPMLAAAKERMQKDHGDRTEIGKNAPTETAPAENGMNKELQNQLGMRMTLKEALAYGNTPKEIVAMLDEKLKQIRNN